MVDLPIVIEWSPSSLHVLLLSTYFHPRKDFPITPNAFFFAISSLPLGNSNLLFGSAHRKSFTVEGTRRQSVVVVHVLLHEGSAACMKLCRNISGFNGLPFLIDISDPPLSVWHLFLVVLPSLPFAMLTGARAICRKFCGADAAISCFSALGLGARRDRRAICGIYKAYIHTYWNPGHCHRGNVGAWASLDPMKHIHTPSSQIQSPDSEPELWLTSWDGSQAGTILGFSVLTCFAAWARLIFPPNP